MWACEPVRTGHRLRAYAGRATTNLRAHYLSPLRIFYADLRAGPTGQTLIVTPNKNRVNLPAMSTLYYILFLMECHFFINF